MALQLYVSPDSAMYYKATVPLTFTFDGRVGGSIDKQIFLRNDNDHRWYDGISIQAIDTQGNSMASGGISGFYWKLAESDWSLRPEEWDLIDKGNTLSMGEAIGSATSGNITNYISLWVRATVPRGLPIQVIKDIVLRISATEHYIDG